MKDSELIKQILSLLENSSVEEMELTWEGKRLFIKRSAERLVKTETQPTVEIPPTSVEVVSQSVGIFHPLVKEGDMVKEGEKIGFIETLGIKDEILSPASGIVHSLLSEGEIVEYGKLICYIKLQEVEQIEEKTD
ncbi:acetyl-CoA carboxylase biotin carboxyl carrier protein subunit [bacterium]|nr:acetyl-CoA carboxylase biotin carboxyl carrier protein subunit [bacterium]